MFKKIILIFVFILFLLLNYLSIKSFFYNLNGKIIYKNNDFLGSIKYFENVGNIYGVYNKANSLYKQKKYKESSDLYFSILGDKKNELNFRINHNLGNNFYRLGEKLEKEDDRFKSWYKAVEYYQNALNIKYDKETKANLDFVLEKINKEQSKQKNKYNIEKKDW